MDNLKKENKLVLIPKIERYVEYMLDIIFKLPRTEKFSIGTEFKTSLYKLIENVIYLNKISNEDFLENMKILNKIDCILNLNRMYLRIMKKYMWIDEKKFGVAMNLIYEIGKILGGLVKYYGKKIKNKV